MEENHDITCSNENVFKMNPVTDLSFASAALNGHK